MVALTPRTVMFGNPPGPGHQPSKSDLADWMVEIESLAAGGGLSYVNSSLAALDLRAGVTEGQFALVLNADDEGGVYERTGGAWAKVAGIPAIFADSIAAQQSALARDAAEAFSVMASDYAAAAQASREAAALIAGFDPDDYFQTDLGAAGWGVPSLSAASHLVGDVDDVTLSGGVYGVLEAAQGVRPHTFGVLMVIPLYASGGSGTEQIAQKFWAATEGPAEYLRHYREGHGWSDWHKVITGAGNQHFGGAIKSDGDVVAQRSDGDAVIRLNKGVANKWSVGRRQSDDALEFKNYTGAPDLVNVEFGGAPGDGVRIVPKGDISNEANLLSVSAGDARYERAAPTVEWRDVAASRSLNTAYQNTTGGQIMVSLYGSRTNQITVSKDGVTWLGLATLGQAGSWADTVSFKLPPGHFYKVGGGQGNVSYWLELY